MKVQNMTGRTGKPVANQFIIDGVHQPTKQSGKFFQSYKSIIAFRPASGASILIDRDTWDYSTTTGKYRNQFLGETKKETERKIASGEYILTDLN